MSTYGKPIFCMEVTETLHVVEYQPSQRNDHQHNERDRDKEDRRSVKDKKIGNESCYY